MHAKASYVRAHIQLCWSCRVAARESQKEEKPEVEPMKPIPGGETWWPDDLGEPSTSGSQNRMRYAFFPKRQRLLIEQDGKLTTYDSGTHRISGVSQQDSEGQSLAFTSQNGPVKLEDLKQVVV